MKLDRKLQKQLLEQLASAYPEGQEIDAKQDEQGQVVANLWYLDQHGLIEAMKLEVIGAPPTITYATITHKGLDFLADDGGLSAILGVVTVKLHADTVRDLLTAKIAASDLPPTEKEQLISHVRSLPADALRTATTALVERGLDQLPNAIELLRKLLGF